MPVLFTISITKSILETSKYCGTDVDDIREIGSNCAVALALSDLFPEVFVSRDTIYPFGAANYPVKIELPKIARDFIRIFDSLSGMPRLRPLIPAFEFTIKIPDEVIAMIDIDALALSAATGVFPESKMA